jgi:hypothetical protein
MTRIHFTAKSCSAKSKARRLQPEVPRCVKKTGFGTLRLHRPDRATRRQSVRKRAELGRSFDPQTGVTELHAASTRGFLNVLCRLARRNRGDRFQLRSGFILLFEFISSLVVSYFQPFVLFICELGCSSSYQHPQNSRGDWSLSAAPARFCDFNRSPSFVLASCRLSLAKCASTRSGSSKCGNCDSFHAFDSSSSTTK